MYELVIFDCDGVLIDSETLSAHAEADAFTACGFPMTVDEVLTLLAGHSEPVMRSIMEQRFGRPLPEAFATEFRQRREAIFAAHLQASPGIADAIAALPAPCCVGSNSPVHRLEQSLGVTGLLPLFGPHVYSAEHVERPKPAPDLFLHAARQFGANPARCLVVEDSPTGANAARAAGMTCFGYLGASHIRPGHEAKMREAGVHLTFSRMAELVPLMRLAA